MLKHFFLFVGTLIPSEPRKIVFHFKISMDVLGMMLINQISAILISSIINYCFYINCRNVLCHMWKKYFNEQKRLLYQQKLDLSNKIMIWGYGCLTIFQ